MMTYAGSSHPAHRCPLCGGHQALRRDAATGHEKVLDAMQKGVTDHKTKTPRQADLRQLMKHNTGVSNIEITDQNIRAFSATAKKYGIDFALKKTSAARYPATWCSSRAGMPTSSRRPSGSSPQRTWEKRKAFYPQGVGAGETAGQSPAPPAGEGQDQRPGVEL